MLTTLLFALTLATAPGAPADLIHAEHNIELAIRTRAECFSPRECRCADELMKAALAELEAATRLAIPHHGPVDPWQRDRYVEPFATTNAAPEVRTVQATYQLPPAAPLYTAVDWQRDVEAQLVCQCITLKIGPDGATIGNSRPCRCDE